MHLLEVSDDKTIALFHDVAARIYRHDSGWVPHLVREIENIFDRDRNGAFQNGNAIRWVMLNRNFEPVGRIAAFYSHDREGEALIGGIGFYECQDNHEYSNYLFYHAEDWLMKQGVEGVDGPVNFGERHQFWGCLVGGHSEPIYQENYNPPYYESHFLGQGYSPIFESLTYEIGNVVDLTWLEKMYRCSKTEIQYRNFCMENAEQFATDYLSIASQAFNLKNRTVKMDKETVLEQLNIQKGIIQDKFIWFAYAQGTPVGVVGFMLNWSGILNLALQFNIGTTAKSLKGFLLAVIPEYQRGHVLAGLLYHAGRAILSDERLYKTYICGVAGHSKNVDSVLKKFKATPIVKHLTFRKYFDTRQVIPYHFSKNLT